MVGRYSEIGWYRDSHRPLFYDRRTVFFYFTGNLLQDKLDLERRIVMKDKIESILSEVKTKIAAASSENELQNVKSAYVGKQGSLSLLMKELPKLDVSLRPEMGKLLNQAKNEVTELIDAKRLELKIGRAHV